MPFSLNDKHVIVKYHYIDDLYSDRNAFHPCSINEFERQVSFLKNDFKITTVDEVVDAAQKELPEKMCALTFDDGLRDNYQNAVPILKKHGAIGTFFPITKTFEGFLPATHKMHIALSLEETDKLVDIFNTFLKNSFPQYVKKFSISKTKRITTARKIYDEIPTANLKETMNTIPRTVRDVFLDFLFQELKLDEKKFSEELFMSPKDIRELHKKGHIIGSHSHSHEAFDTIDSLIVKEEVATAKRILDDLLESSTSIFAYPQSAPDKNVADILKEQKIQFALTTKPRSVSLDDDPYLIPRYDTNHVRDFIKEKIL